MDLGGRKDYVELLEDRGEQDAQFNPILTRVGGFYAHIYQPAPKEAINTGQTADVQHLQITFQASEIKRLNLNSAQMLRVYGLEWQVNSTPYFPFEGNRFWARINASRKAKNG